MDIFITKKIKSITIIKHYIPMLKFSELFVIINHIVKIWVNII